MTNTPRMVQREMQPIRPVTTFQVHKKAQIYHRMAKYGCYSVGSRKGSTFSGYVPYGTNRDDNVVYVFTAEKVRAKWDHANHPNIIVDGKPRRLMNSKKIRAAHWDVRVYQFNRNEIKSIEQGLRTFRVVLK